MEIKYYVGIDFGHGETCASRVPGYGIEEVSQIPLRRTSLVQMKKVLSAIYRKDGQWKIVLSKNDFKKDDLREGFKGPIYKLRRDNPQDLEALKEFGKLIFSSILENDSDLKYNEETGESNFIICIANPSEWRRENPKTPEEYLNFFKTECGIKPATLCINESDAAFYTKFSIGNGDYSPDDTIFVIDLGSSTIDFTTYSKSKCVADGCWGHNLGAHLIDDKILSKGLENPKNRENLQKVAKLRQQMGMEDNLNSTLSLYARESKELFYTNKDDFFELLLRFSDFVPIKGEEAIDKAFYIALEKEEFDEVIADYRNQLELAIKNAAEKLKNNIMASPNRVILSGGASRMDFVAEFTRKYFPDAEIDLDQTPEWVVSNGAARYIQAQYDALERLKKVVGEIDYKEIYKDADVTATQKATNELMPEVLAAITGPQNMTGIEIRDKLCWFFFGLNNDNPQYVKLFTETANEILKEKISASIKQVVMDVFKVDVDVSNISLDYTFVVMCWRKVFFIPEQVNGALQAGNGCIVIQKAIENSSGRFDFTWGIARDRSEREKIANGCKSLLSVKNPFNVSFDDNGLNEAAYSIRSQSLEIAEKLFHEKELFKTSNYR